MAISSSRNLACAYCSGPVDADAGPRCSSCGTAHHVDCWVDFGGCTTMGCKSSPDMRKYQGAAS
jgi:hypothetical protein